MNLNKELISQTATAVRCLSMDGVQSANSGHPGLPLGCADIASVLYTHILKHDPSDPKWLNRDRFILSAGHGSMLLYSILHLTGYNLPLDELKNFRQNGSLTPGHPEYGHTDGVEATTGPLGAGLSNAVGIAMAETHLAAKLNAYGETIVDHYTYALAGDGCMMEGITSEAASLAGHLKLGKLIAFYDSNSITIEGNTSLAFTEDVAMRYEAYGWQVLKGDAHNVENIAELVEQAKAEKEKPSIIILTSIIGKGAPNKEGSHKVHGAPLGDEEISATRKNLCVPDEAFYIEPSIKDMMDKKKAEWKSERENWQKRFDAVSSNADFKKVWDEFFGAKTVNFDDLPSYNVGDKKATRVCSGAAIQELAKNYPSLVGGSADLAPSNNTDMKEEGWYSVEDRSGRNFHFGVREHAMGGIANGMLLHSGLRTYCATFLVFSDYMRPTVRLASLMNIPQIFVFTHDSIFVGEDGPTHQPIEHTEALRNIPGVLVLRPADGEETNLIWKMALEEQKRPSALILTRQNLEVFEKPANWKEDAAKGGYIALDSNGKPDTVILASGSEVNMAIEAVKISGKNVRVVSVPCREYLYKNSDHLAKLTEGARVISAEAGIAGGWYKAADEAFSIETFGLSAPGAVVAKELGFTAEKLAEIL